MVEIKVLQTGAGAAWNSASRRLAVLCRAASGVKEPLVYGLLRVSGCDVLVYCG